MPSNHLILCHPLLLPPSIFPSIRVFSNELVLHIRWPKYGSFSFSISPSNEYLGLISFRIDWLDLPADQGTLKSLLQHHSSKASILKLPTFFIVQLSHPYMTTGKTIALTRWTFVGKVMSLLFYMLSMLVITFLPRSKHLTKNKVSHCFLCFPNYLPWNDGTGFYGLSFVLAWRIPRTGEPGGLPSMGSHGVGHDWSDLAAVAAAGMNYLVPFPHLKCFKILLSLKITIILIGFSVSFHLWPHYLFGLRFQDFLQHPFQRQRWCLSFFFFF